MPIDFTKFLLNIQDDKSLIGKYGDIRGKLLEINNNESVFANISFEVLMKELAEFLAKDKEGRNISALKITIDPPHTPKSFKSPSPLDLSPIVLPLTLQALEINGPLFTDPKQLPILPKNLKTLIINYTNFSDLSSIKVPAGVEDITLMSTYSRAVGFNLNQLPIFPKNLKKLDVSYNELIDLKVIDNFLKHYKFNKNLKIKGLGENHNIFVTELSRIYKAQTSPDQTISPEDVGKILLKVAAVDHSGKIVRYIIEQGKIPNSGYDPCPMNVVDSDGHNLLYYYSHSREMQQYLFANGVLPPKPSNNSELEILNNSESVHSEPVNREMNFYVNKLVQEVKYSDQELQTTKSEIVNALQDFAKKFTSDKNLALSLYEITKGEKEGAVQTALPEQKMKYENITHNEEFIKNIIEDAITALKILENLQSDSFELSYGDNKLSARKIIALEMLYIKQSKPVRKMAQELCATSFEQNPIKIQEKFEQIKKLIPNCSVEQLTKKSECHKLLNDITDDTILDKIFHIVNETDITEVWREQSLFKLTKQIFTSANAREERDRPHSCDLGALNYIAETVGLINSEFKKQYDAEEVKREQQELTAPKITDNNASLLLDKVVVNEKGKIIYENTSEKIPKRELDGDKIKALQNFVKEEQPELQQAFIALVYGNIEVDKPKDIPVEGDKIVAKINELYLNHEHIKQTFPKYNLINKPIPTLEECIAVMKKVISLPKIIEVAQELDKELQDQQKMQEIKAGVSHLVVNRVSTPSTSNTARANVNKRRNFAQCRTM